MPPSLRQKRGQDAREFTSRRALLEALDTPPEPSADEIKASKFFNGDDSSSEDSSDSSLSEVEEEETRPKHSPGGDDDDDDDEGVDWEDVTSNATPQTTAPVLRDLSIILERNEEAFTPYSPTSKKGPSKIDRL
ncbi:hypothetical protein FQN49_003542, partial [Arthroderma sp. PD_2]